MAETARLNLTVDTDIPDLLTILADGERKRGQFLSKAFTPGTIWPTWPLMNSPKLPASPRTKPKH